MLQCCCGSAGEEAEEGAAGGPEGGQAEPTGMRVIYEQLSTCTTSERADEIAINFCLIQTKSVLHTFVSCLLTFTLHRGMCWSTTTAPRRQANRWISHAIQ